MKHCIFFLTALIILAACQRQKTVNTAENYADTHVNESQEMNKSQEANASQEANMSEDTASFDSYNYYDAIEPPQGGEEEVDTIVSDDKRLMFIYWRPITTASAPAWGNICVWEYKGKTHRKRCSAQGFQTIQDTTENYYEGCPIIAIYTLKTRTSIPHADAGQHLHSSRDEGTTLYLVLTNHKVWGGLAYAQAQVVTLAEDNVYATLAFPQHEPLRQDTLMDRMGIEFSIGAWVDSDYDDSRLLYFDQKSERLYMSLTDYDPNYFDPVVSAEFAVYQWRNTKFVYVGTEKRK